jgi:hypothetical protein
VSVQSVLAGVECGLLAKQDVDCRLAAQLVARLVRFLERREYQEVADVLDIIDLNIAPEAP